MNLELFIAKRISLNKKSAFSGFIVKIAIAAVTLSLSVMIISTAVVTGFKTEVSQKVFNFFGHIHINSFDNNQSKDDIIPVSKHQDFYNALDTLDDISHVQVFANKAGIIKTKNSMIEGIVIRGVGNDFDWNNFQPYLVEGKQLEVGDSTKSNEILISKHTAQRLQLVLGDKLLLYFIQDPPRYRMLTIGGIYKTGMEEVDKKFALIDIRHIQKINEWEEHEVGGFSIYINDLDKLEQLDEYIYARIDPALESSTIKDQYPGIFEWLNLANLNEAIILTLMALIAIINMITVLLILILERANMVGILKALGARDWTIRKVFIYNAAYIIVIGMLLGNLIGISICLAQAHFEFLSLPEAAYYLDTVPINLKLSHLVLLNVGTFICCALVMVIPTYLVKWINPIKAIRFD